MDAINVIERNIVLSQSNMIIQKNFWLNKFKDISNITDLHFPINELNGEFTEGKVDFTIDKEIGEKIITICKNKEFSVFIFILTCLNILQNKYSKEENTIIASPIIDTNNKRKDIFNEFVVFANNLKDDLSFKELLLLVGKNVKESYSNQQYPLEIIFDELYKGKPNCNPPTKIAFSNYTLQGKEKLEGFDLNVSYLIEENELKFNIFFNVNLYNAEYINLFHSHLRNILNLVVENLDINLIDIDIKDSDEISRILNEFNTEIDYSFGNKRLNDILKSNVSGYPDKIALVHNDQYISYKTLYDHYFNISNGLLKYGVKKNTVICVSLDRSVDLIYMVLAIWEVGAIYLPIETKYPTKRIQNIIDDSNAAYFISTTENILSKSNELINVNLININELCAIKHDECIVNDVFLGNDISYIIYTSGSTGKPKGVIVKHNGMLNHLDVKSSDFSMENESRLSFNSNITFDISIWQMFTSLYKGATTIIFDDDLIFEYETFLGSLVKSRITILEIVPSYLNILLQSEKFSSLKYSFLKYLVITGEKFEKSLAQKMISLVDNITVVNAYGPTEASDDITHYFFNKLPEIENIPIGAPIKNNKIVIVDKNMKLCPIGVNGEICVYGTGLGLGYINKIEETNGSFVENPFDSKYPLIYKTGDIGRWLYDGNIDFKSRNNRQIKFHGYRIELDEIEVSLKKIQSIEDAVVFVHKDSNGNDCIVACVVSDQDVDTKGVNAFLSESLTEYMIPGRYITLSEFPVNDNGKIDVNTLKKIVDSSKDDFHRKINKPQSKLEIKIAGIWAQVLNLNIEEIGIDVSFFEIGGNSLSAISLINKLQKEVEIKITTKDLFNNPTIGELIGNIEEFKSDFIEINKAKIKDLYSLSSSQERLFFTHKSNPESTSYNISNAVILEGNLDQDKLTESFTKLIDRQESLRTSFIEVDGVPFQKIENEFKFEIENIQIDTIENSSEMQSIVNNFIRPFDLSLSPLLRVGLFLISTDKYLLVIDMHHIISDGFSHQIMFADLFKFYNGEEISPLKIQYKDYSEYQNNEAYNQSNIASKEYWNERLKDYKSFQLPYDYNQANMFDYSGGVIKFDFNKDLSNKLIDFCDKNDVTLYMLLLSVYYVFIHRITNKDDLIIGTVVAGRNHSDLEEIIGFFVNVLALRNNPKKEMSFIEFLLKVKDDLLSDFEHQDYPFDDLTKDIRKHRNYNEELISTMFTLQDFNYSNIESYSKLGFEIKSVKFEYNQEVGHKDFIFNVNRTKDSLDFFVIYKTSIFKKETIESLIEIYKNIVSILIAKNMNVSIDELVSIQNNKDLIDKSQNKYQQKFNF